MLLSAFLVVTEARAVARETSPGTFLSAFRRRGRNKPDQVQCSSAKLVARQHLVHERMIGGTRYDLFRSCLHTVSRIAPCMWSLYVCQPCEQDYLIFECSLCSFPTGDAFMSRGPAGEQQRSSHQQCRIKTNTLIKNIVELSRRRGW